MAQLAGVSQAMVSYVLNDNTNISVPDETRQRILDAMNEIGYVPNRAARSLRTQRTNTIACVVPDITNPFHTIFARGLQGVAEQHEVDVVFL
ncbi:MAG: LacI family transcriptional regulator [Anaerolineae bacterium]|nr:LacI family transcriptional regulator [Anaerolineae bacterium]